MMKKALYSAVIVAFMCSGLAYAEKVSMKEYLTELKTSEYTEVQETWKKVNAGMASYLEVLEAEEKAIRLDLELNEMSAEKRKQLKAKLKKNLAVQKELKDVRARAGF